MTRRGAAIISSLSFSVGTVGAGSSEAEAKWEESRDNKTKVNYKSTQTSKATLFPPAGSTKVQPIKFKFFDESTTK